MDLSCHRGRRAAGASALLLLLLIAGVGWHPLPAVGQDTDDTVIVEDGRLHPSLSGVQVAGAGRSETVGGYRNAQGRLDAARADLATTASDIEATTGQRDRLDADVAAASAERNAARSEILDLRNSLRGLAVQRYKRGGSNPGGSIDLEAVDVELRQQAMVNTVSTNKTLELRSALSTVDRTTALIDAAAVTRADLSSQLDELSGRRLEEEGRLMLAVVENERSRAALADWRLGADVAGTDIPLVVLDAYVKAAERMGQERPECGLRWWGLAGIGKVETRHATYSGTRPGPDGVTLRQIIGIPLDGSNNTAVITDTDGGFLDGDPVFDRAVGPMQFIPGTWRSLGRDATGDGRADPHNVYDAAFSAAGLLCRSGGEGLDRPEPLRRAALGYNASGYYADLVVREAFAYADRADTIVPPPPPATDAATLQYLATLAGSTPTPPAGPSSPPSSVPPAPPPPDPAR